MPPPSSPVPHGLCSGIPHAPSSSPVHPTMGCAQRPRTPLILTCAPHHGLRSGAPHAPHPHLFPPPWAVLRDPARPSPSPVPCGLCQAGSPASGGGLAPLPEVLAGEPRATVWELGGAGSGAGIWGRPQLGSSLVQVTLEIVGSCLLCALGF